MCSAEIGDLASGVTLTCFDKLPAQIMSELSAREKPFNTRELLWTAVNVLHNNDRNPMPHTE
jgi:hypothetical protein